MATILIIDDNETIRMGLEHVINKLGHKPLVAGSGEEGLKLFGKNEVDFVITDLKMDGIDGVQVLKAIAESDPDVPAMIITAFGTVETAVTAMKMGAFDFIEKPFAPEVVQLKVERALQLRNSRKAQLRLESENEYLKRDAAGKYGDMVGAAPCMESVFTLIGKVSRTDSAVFIHGESGTGKELVARAIHDKSNRKDKAFVKVNCGALTETLLESELFGHEKGAFTGAIRRRIGRFELADKGTLFLDEVGDISPALQLKLLRVLQEREFERVGGESTIHVDVRILSATNRDLKKEVEEGRFREDLYYRLHIIPLKIPPLRERREDIPLLVAHFIEKLSSRTNPQVKGIDDEALSRLITYGWPGNVRQLENAIEQAMVFAEKVRVDISALPDFLQGQKNEGTLALPKGEGEMSLPELLDDLERQLILKAFNEAQGVKTETARRLGIKTSALYYKLDKYDIDD
jgi:two-component system, NtrC family, response regulator HydG